MNEIKLWGWGNLSPSQTVNKPTKIASNITNFYVSKKQQFLWQDSSLFTWGDFFSSPVFLTNFQTPPSQVVQVNSHTLVLSRGTLYQYDPPSLSSYSFSEEISQVAEGSDHLVSLDSQGRVHSWGNPSKGKLGQGTYKEGAGRVPTPVEFSGVIRQVACGYSHTLALDQTGKVFSWGSGADGRLGLASTQDTWEPSEVHGLLGKSIVALSCGYLHSAVLSSTGELLTFGFNGYGQLGTGNNENSYEPSLVYSLSGHRVVQVACGAFHTLVLSSTGEMFSMGLGSRGQLGTGAFTNAYLPESVRGRIPEFTNKFVSILCGTDTSFVLCELEVSFESKRNSLSSTKEASQILETLSVQPENSFRPSNLPPKDPSEAALHRKLVAEQARMYLDRIREKEKLQRKEKQRKLAREAQIKQLMNEWETQVLPFWDRKKNSKQVERLIWKGIPSKHRGEVWLKLLGNPLSITSEYFQIYIEKARNLRLALEKGEAQALGKESSLKGVEIDISRTFKQLGYFKEGSPLKEQLSEMLEAFTLCRPDIGYVQGMSYVAGTFLLNLEPYKAFLMFYNLVAWPVLLPFYRVDTEGITMRVQLFRVLLKNNLPDLCDHLDCNNVQPNMYLMEWFLTLYTRPLTQEVASRIWDLAFYYGPVVLFKAGVAILKLMNYLMLREELSGIMGLFNRVGNLIQDPEVIVEQIAKIEVPDWIQQEISRLGQEIL
mgnify:CR=1 FL=1